jgi:hypothetical protein
VAFVEGRLTIFRPCARVLRPPPLRAPSRHASPPEYAMRWGQILSRATDHPLPVLLRRAMAPASPVSDATRMPWPARRARLRKLPAPGWAPRPPAGPARGIHPPQRGERIRRKEGNARSAIRPRQATFRVDGTTCRARRVSWSSKWVGVYRGVGARPSTGSGWGHRPPSIDRDRHPGARDGGVLLSLISLPRSGVEHREMDDLPQLVVVPIVD